jgi:acetyl esterase
LKFSHSHTEGINATATLLLAGLEKTMQLDTHVRNLLDMFANSGQPKIWELAPAEARNMALALTQMVEGKEPIGKIENGSLPGPEGALPFRIYTPASAGAEPLACIVYFHGGAWIFGNLDTHDCMCRMLANASGCRVISVDYRLAPEHKFPASVEDAYAATKWVAANASGIGVDPARIVVAGDSAGGNLAAVVCQQAKTGGPKIGFAGAILPRRRYWCRKPIAPRFC